MRFLKHKNKVFNLETIVSFEPETRLKDDDSMVVIGLRINLANGSHATIGGSKSWDKFLEWSMRETNGNSTVEF